MAYWGLYQAIVVNILVKYHSFLSVEVSTLFSIGHYGIHEEAVFLLAWIFVVVAHQNSRLNVFVVGHELISCLEKEYFFRLLLLKIKDYSFVFNDHLQQVVIYYRWKVF